MTLFDLTSRYSRMWLGAGKMAGCGIRGTAPMLEGLKLGQRTLWLSPDVVLVLEEETT